MAARAEGRSRFLRGRASPGSERCLDRGRLAATIGRGGNLDANDTTLTNPNSENLCTRDPICDLLDKVIGDVLVKGDHSLCQSR